MQTISRSGATSGTGTEFFARATARRAHLARGCGAVTLAFVVIMPLAAQETGRTVALQNLSTQPRVEWFEASFPFVEGTTFEPLHQHVEGHPTAWRVLERWPDGSVRIGQAQFLDAMNGLDSRQLRLVEGDLPVPDFALHPAVAAAHDFAIVTAVTDQDGVPYFAVTQPLADPGATVLEDTGAVRTLRLRTYHTNPQGLGIGRDFTSQTCYVSFFSGLPYAVVDVVVANDYLGSDHPDGDPNHHALGDVGFSSVDVYTVGANALLQHAAEHGAAPAIQGLIGPSSTWIRLLSRGYFADGQGKRWRLIVLFGDAQRSPAEQAMWRQVAVARAECSVIPLADHAGWQQAGAFGLVGGPVPPPHDANQRAVNDYRTWKSTAEFGPYGGWGDTKASFAGGTPRNGPMTETGAHAIQTGLCLPALQIEAMAFQQTLRPYHLWNLRVEPTDDIFLWDPLPYSLTSTRQVSHDTLGRLPLQQNDPWRHWRQGVPLGVAHGWSGYEPEHFSLDILFEHYALTGDHRSRDEIVNLAESAMGATRPFTYASKDVLPARAEGWIAQALVKAWFATGDDRYIDHLRQRVATVLEPGRQKSHVSRALYFQPSSAHTPFPTPHRFYMAWQHAAVVYGLLPLWTYFGDATARAIAHDVVHTVADSWVTSYQSAQFGFVAEGLRYQTPCEYAGVTVPADVWDHTPGIGAVFGTAPLQGSAMFLVGALDLLREDGLPDAEAQMALHFRKALLFPTPQQDGWRWLRWCFLREAPVRNAAPVPAALGASGGLAR